MAYKPVQYDFFNPMSELVPLVLIYNKAYQALDKKYEEYMDWLSSSSELLDRDEGAKALKEKYQNDLNIMADALAKGDLRTAHTVDPRRYWYPLKTKQKQAEMLSSIIKSQLAERPKYVFSKIYNEDTPLSEVGEGKYTKTPLDEIERNGMSYGKDLNETDPEITGQLFDGAVSILSQGYTQLEVLDMIANSDPEIMNRINSEVLKYETADEGEQNRIRNAFVDGMLRQIGVSKSHISNPRTPRQVALEAREDARLRLQDATDEFNRTGGDYNKLKEIGEAREWVDDKGQTWVAIGSNNYKTRLMTDDEAKQKALRENPSLANNEEALEAAAEKYKNQRIAYGGAYSNASATRGEKEEKRKNNLEILGKDKYLSNKVRPISYNGTEYGFAEGTYHGTTCYIPYTVSSDGKVVAVENLLIDDFINILLNARIGDTNIISNSLYNIYGDSNTEVKKAVNDLQSRLLNFYVKNQEAPKTSTVTRSDTTTTVRADLLKVEKKVSGQGGLGGAKGKKQ